MDNDWAAMARRCAENAEEPQPRDAGCGLRLASLAGLAGGSIGFCFLPGSLASLSFWPMALAGAAGTIPAAGIFWAARAVAGAWRLRGDAGQGEGRGRRSALGAFLRSGGRMAALEARLGWAQALLLPRVAAAEVAQALRAAAMAKLRGRPLSLEFAQACEAWSDALNVRAVDELIRGEEAQAIAFGPVETWRLARRCALKGEAERVASLFVACPFDPRWPMPMAPDLERSTWSAVAMRLQPGYAALHKKHAGREGSLDAALSIQAQLRMMSSPWFALQGEEFAAAGAKARALREAVEMQRALRRSAAKSDAGAPARMASAISERKTARRI